jgi:hypothetical protein
MARQPRGKEHEAFAVEHPLDVVRGNSVNPETLSSKATMV